MIFVFKHKNKNKVLPYVFKTIKIRDGTIFLIGQFNKGVGGSDNGSKGHIFCIIVVKFLKFFGQKRLLSFTRLYLYFFSKFL